MLRLAQVIDATGLRRSKIYELQAHGDFPRRVKIASRSVGWIEAEVQAWLAHRIAKSAASEAGNEPARRSAERKHRNSLCFLGLTQTQRKCTKVPGSETGAAEGFERAGKGYFSRCSAQGVEARTPGVTLESGVQTASS
jgi:prophage regulatory protein